MAPLAATDAVASGSSATAAPCPMSSPGLATRITIDEKREPADASVPVARCAVCCTELSAGDVAASSSSLEKTSVRPASNPASSVGELNVPIAIGRSLPRRSTKRFGSRSEDHTSELLLREQRKGAPLLEIAIDLAAT